MRAVVAGWRPEAGSGKHSHLNAGQGLSVSPKGGYEGGWDNSWTNDLVAAADSWNNNTFNCPNEATRATWLAPFGDSERQPINCETWDEAYAFCIWDGAFLPSEAEWNYAAAGGSEERIYPWSSPPRSQTIDCSYANYLGNPEPPHTSCARLVIGDVGSDSPKGDARWGQSDLAGNMSEWTLDGYNDYPTHCIDCVNQNAGAPVIRGGSYESNSAGLAAAVRGYFGQLPQRDPTIGARCARLP